MSRDPSMRRRATGALVVIAFLVGGCGSGAVDGPDEDDGASDRTDEGDSGEPGGDDNGDSDDGGGGNGGSGDGGDGSGGGDRDSYSWELPLGDITPDSAYILYTALREGCDKGRAELDASEHGYLSDAQRRLYEAAIAVCRGDVELGRRLYAGTGYGTSRSMCFINAAVVSVLEQRPADTTGCPPNSGSGTTSTTEPEGSTATTESTTSASTSTSSTSTTGGGTTTSTGEGETTTTEAAGVGDGGG